MSVSQAERVAAALSAALRSAPYSAIDAVVREVRTYRQEYPRSWRAFRRTSTLAGLVAGAIDEAAEFRGLQEDED